MQDKLFAGIDFPKEREKKSEAFRLVACCAA